MRLFAKPGNARKVALTASDMLSAEHDITCHIASLKRTYNTYILYYNDWVRANYHEKLEQRVRESWNNIGRVQRNMQLHYGKDCLNEFNLSYRLPEPGEGNLSCMPIFSNWITGSSQERPIKVGGALRGIAMASSDLEALGRFEPVITNQSMPSV